MSMHSGAQQRGFTLVELISVLVLLGVLSAVAFARFADTSSYREGLLVDKIHSYLRLTQQVALAHQNERTQLSMAHQGEHWEVDIASGDSHRTFEFDTDAEIAIDGQLLNSTLLLEFSSAGDLLQRNFPATSSVAQSIELSINQSLLCLSPSGYSYEGSCR